MAPWSKTVSSILTRLGAEAAGKRGIGPHEFQRLTGISPSETQDADGRTPAAKHIAMLNLIEQRPAYWDISEHYQNDGLPTPFTTLFGVVANAPNLNTAFENYLNYRALIGDVDGITLKREGSDFEFEYILEGEGRTSVSAFGNLVAMAKLAKCYEGSNSNRIPVIELTGKAFAPISQLRDIERCDLRFGQARNRMVLSAPLSGQAYPQHHKVLYEVFCKQAESEIRRLHERYSFACRVESCLMGLVREPREYAAQCNALEAVCDRFAISRSAMHRRLQKENTNFQSIMLRARLSEAKRLLAHQDVAIADVSDTLGFSSPSAFSRFFSDQCGLSPSRYRSLNSPIRANEWDLPISGL